MPGTENIVMDRTDATTHAVDNFRDVLYPSLVTRTFPLLCVSLPLPFLF